MMEVVKLIGLFVANRTEGRVFTVTN